MDKVSYNKGLKKVSRDITGNLSFSEEKNAKGRKNWKLLLSTNIIGGETTYIPEIH